MHILRATHRVPLFMRAAFACVIAIYHRPSIGAMGPIASFAYLHTISMHMNYDLRTKVHSL